MSQKENPKIAKTLRTNIEELPTVESELTEGQLQQISGGVGLNFSPTVPTSSTTFTGVSVSNQSGGYICNPNSSTYRCGCPDYDY
jgi:hypothetical protein